MDLIIRIIIASLAGIAGAGIGYFFGMLDGASSYLPTVFGAIVGFVVGVAAAMDR